MLVVCLDIAVEYSCSWTGNSSVVNFFSGNFESSEVLRLQLPKYLALTGTSFLEN